MEWLASSLTFQFSDLPIRPIMTIKRLKKFTGERWWYAWRKGTFSQRLWDPLQFIRVRGKAANGAALRFSGYPRLSRGTPESYLLRRFASIRLSAIFCQTTLLSLHQIIRYFYLTRNTPFLHCDRHDSTRVRPYFLTFSSRITAKRGISYYESTTNKGIDGVEKGLLSMHHPSKGGPWFH